MREARDDTNKYDEKRFSQVKDDVVKLLKAIGYKVENIPFIPISAFVGDNVVKKSKDAFLDLVEHTYRVLLSRGMKGCYLHFVDKDTERFFKSRIESSGS
jgi:hypothetical protein